MRGRNTETQRGKKKGTEMRVNRTVVEEKFKKLFFPAFP